jgi:hypothetical protein
MDIYEHLRLNGNEVTTFQIDRPKRQVFVKFANTHTFTALHDRSQGKGYINKEQARYLGSVFALLPWAGGTSG